jgi:hypothetical protein
MNETPHGPRRRADDGHGRPGVPAAPTGSSGPPPTDSDLDDDDYGDDAEPQPNRRRLLSGGRLVAMGAVVIVAGSGLALALTSSGGGGGDAGAGGSSSDEPTSEDAAFEFAECMREQGIEDYPDPQVDDNGVITSGPDDPEDLSPQEQVVWQEAQEACQGILDQASPAGREEPSAEELAERQDQALSQAQCMRDRGWDLPDPEITEDGGISMPISPDADSPIPGPGDPQEDQFEQDRQECHEQSGLPTPEGGVVGGRDGGGQGGGGS